MKPIHEALFAFGMLFLAVLPFVLLGTLITLVLCLLRKRAGRVSFVVMLTGLTLITALALLVTLSLHRSVDENVARGGYGPPSEVRLRMAEEIAGWHASATRPAQMALAFHAAFALLAGVAWFFRFRWRRPVAHDPSPELRTYESVLLGLTAVAVAAALVTVW